MIEAQRFDQFMTNMNALKSSLSDVKDDQVKSDFATLLQQSTDMLQTMSDVMKTTEEANVLQNADSVNSNSYKSKLDLYDNLLLDSEEFAIRSRPNLGEFLSVTDLPISDANEILYGVIGANADLRDWSKIMASNNPAEAARAATRQLYNSDKDYALVKDPDYGTDRFSNTLSENSLSSKSVLRQSNNFADIDTLGTVETMAVSQSGLLLRGAGETETQIRHTAWLFGFDEPSWLE